MQVAGFSRVLASWCHAAHTLSRPAGLPDFALLSLLLHAMENFLNILVAVLLVACVPHPGDAAAPTCPADGTEVCYNCATKGDCSGGSGAALPGIECSPGEACKVVSGLATCMPLAQVPQCNCGGAAIGCDAYNTDLKIFCVPPGAGRSVYTGEDCATSSSPMTCAAGQCVAGSAFTCTGKPTNFYVQTPRCSSGIFCAGGTQVSTMSCSAGQYFNVANGACEAYPPNPCTGCIESKCPIISDCTKYAVCNNGQVVDDEESCAANEVFSSDDGECVPGSAPVGICARYADCVFESSGSTVPTVTPSSSGGSGGGNVNNPVPTLPPCTAANVDQRYPHADCERYYTCREVTRNSFRYNDSKCPSPYAFNPTILRCDERSKVPNCPAST